MASAPAASWMMTGLVGRWQKRLPRLGSLQCVSGTWMLGLRAQMLWLMCLEDEKACCCVWVFSVLGDTQQVPVEYFSFAAQGPEMAGKAKHMRVCSSHHGLDATKSWRFWKRATSTGAVGNHTPTRRVRCVEFGVRASPNVVRWSVLVISSMEAAT